MNRGTSIAQPVGLVEPLDIDLDSLDHALMDLLTSDWQTLDDSDFLPTTAEDAPRAGPLS